MEVIKDGFDDFLNECFCKSQDARMELLTHLFNIAPDECAEWAMDNVESGDHENKELENKNKPKKAKAKSQGNWKSKTVMKGDGGLEARPILWCKSKYKIQKEKTITENKALWASLKNPKLEKAMEELKKDVAAAKRKNKDTKPKPEEHCTSTCLNDGAKM